MTAALASTSVIAITAAISQRRNSHANDNTPPAPTGPATAAAAREDLAKAIEAVTYAAEKRSKIPVLSNVHIASSMGRIVFTTTDMDVEISNTIPAATKRKFSTTVPAHLLKDLVKKAPKGDMVTIEAGDGHDTIDFGKVSYRLQSIPGSEFPFVQEPDASSATVFEMAGVEVLAGIESTLGAMSEEATRYYLNGVFLHVNQDAISSELRFVATDGHRLYRQSFAVPANASNMPGVIIPRKTVEILHKLMRGKACPQTVRLMVTAGKIRFAFGDTIVTSKTVDGTYPDYNRVIPASSDKSANFESAELEEALHAVTLIASEKSRAAKLEIGANFARVSVNNPDKGASEATIECGYNGDPIEIGFNAGYMIAALELAGGSVAISMSDAGSPVAISGQRKGWMAVVMPMRV